MAKDTVFWVVDTGATNRITHSLDLLSTFHNIQPFTMSLPNVFKTGATISGSVKIYVSITLHNVHHIPSFNVNLIYVPRSMDSLNCDV